MPVGAYGGRADLMAHIAPEGAGLPGRHAVRPPAGDGGRRRDAGPADARRLRGPRGDRRGAGGRAARRRPPRPAARSRSRASGSLLTVFFRSGVPRNWAEAGTSDRDAYARFFGAMLDDGRPAARRRSSRPGSSRPRTARPRSPRRSTAARRAFARMSRRSARAALPPRRPRRCPWTPRRSGSCARPAARCPSTAGSASARRCSRSPATPPCAPRSRSSRSAAWAWTPRSCSRTSRRRSPASGVAFDIVEGRGPVIEHPVRTMADVRGAAPVRARGRRRPAARGDPADPRRVARCR